MGRRRLKTVGTSDSGQAVVEYLLILFITVFIAVTLLKQFNGAFRSYAQNFFGNYIACLLETGELPGMSQTCASVFVPFNIADGDASDPNPNGGGGKGGNGKGGKGNGDGGSGSGDGDDGQTAGAGQGDEGGSSGDGETLAGSSNRGITRKVGRAGMAGQKFKSHSTPIGSASEVKEQSSLEGADSMIGVAPTSTSVGTVGVGDRKAAAVISGQYWGEEEEEDRATTRPASASVKQESGGGGLRPKKSVEVAKSGPPKPIEQGGGEFSIGGLIKALLIIGIIVIIFVFFGGQVMQISKSWEK